MESFPQFVVHTRIQLGKRRDIFFDKKRCPGRRQTNPQRPRDTPGAVVDFPAGVAFQGAQRPGFVVKNMAGVGEFQSMHAPADFHQTGAIFPFQGLELSRQSRLGDMYLRCRFADAAVFHDGDKVSIIFQIHLAPPAYKYNL